MRHFSVIFFVLFIGYLDAEKITASHEKRQTELMAKFLPILQKAIPVINNLLQQPVFFRNVSHDLYHQGGNPATGVDGIFTIPNTELYVHYSVDDCNGFVRRRFLATGKCKAIVTQSAAHIVSECQDANPTFALACALQAEFVKLKQTGEAHTG